VATAYYYADTDAPGGGDGSIGSPWTWAEAKAADDAGVVVPGDIVYIKGSSVLSLSAQTFAQAGTNHNWIEWRGYTTTPGDGGLCYLKFNGTPGNHLLTLPSVPYRGFRNFDLDGNGTANRLISTNNVFSLYNCRLHDCTGYAAYRYGSIFRCEFDTIQYTGGSGALIGCKVNNGNGSAGSDSIFGCIFKGTNIAVGYPRLLMNSIIDAAGNGTQLYLQGGQNAMNIIIVNVASGQRAINFSDSPVDTLESFAANINFWNCDTLSNADSKILGYTQINPMFKDADNFDYRITNPNLRGAGLSKVGLLTETIDYEGTPGIDQVAITLPDDGKVLTSVTAFGWDADPDVGEYVPAATTDVRDGVTFGDEAAEEGDVVLPPENKVELNEGYGSGGTEKTGSAVFSVRSEMMLEVSSDPIEAIVEVA